MLVRVVQTRAQSPFGNVENRGNLVIAETLNVVEIDHLPVLERKRVESLDELLLQIENLRPPLGIGIEISIREARILFQCVAVLVVIDAVVVLFLFFFGGTSVPRWRQWNTTMCKTRSDR